MMPFSTKFAAVKLASRTVVLKLMSESTASNSSKATSDGELTRVVTFGVRTESESSGKTR